MSGAQETKRRMAGDGAEVGGGSQIRQGLVGLVKEDLGLYSKGNRNTFHKGMT